jgi:two-component system, OmpR family, KDP operon response regulator KdpE
MVSLLLIEDDLPIRESLERALVQRGHVVVTAGDGLAGLQSAVDERPDLVVLDLGLPDIDGRDLLRMLRAVSDVPVIVSTARDEDAEIVGSLDNGADDYLVKPFSADELDARVRAVLRRGRSIAADAVIQIGGLRIDRRAHEVSIDGTPVMLTRKEFELLEYLARNEGAVVPKRELLAEVWEQPTGGGERTVDVHLSWLRGKLGESASDPVYLHTVRGVGVRLTAPG